MLENTEGQSKMDNPEINKLRGLILMCVSGCV